MRSFRPPYNIQFGQRHPFNVRGKYTRYSVHQKILRLPNISESLQSANPLQSNQCLQVDIATPQLNTFPRAFHALVFYRDRT